MQAIAALIDFILHIDEHLAQFVQDYRGWTYAILFAIVFAETGLVVTPLLPGDSLLFAAGAIAALGGMNVVLLILVLIVAAVAGDAVNYSVGRWLGPRVFEQDRWFLKKDHLRKTQEFYDRYGGKTIILARFVPIVRTYAPFVAGVAQMPYARFGTYNIIGGVAWVVVCTLAGYLFGNIPWIREHFEAVLLAIIFVSLIPMFVELARGYWASRKQSP